jgi:steroid 5-alpha reductase family enzyme
MNPGLFFLLNVTFISFLQNVLLFLITTPAYVMLLVSRINETMALADIMFARVLMVLILLEYFADQQQWGEYMMIVLKTPVHLTFLYQISKTQRKPIRRVPKFPTGTTRKILIAGLW